MFNFFQKPAFGIDISDYSIEIIFLTGSIQNPRLLALGRKELPQGLIEDGKILNKAGLSSLVRELWLRPKFGKIKTKKLIFSLPESKSFFHIFELPQEVKEKEISEYARYQAKENFPYSLEELYLDYKIENRKVFLAAIPKEIVNDYLEVFEDCSLEPLVLEIESLCLARAILQKGKEPVLILDIGAKATNLNVFDRGEIELSFSVPAGGDKFTKALSERLAIPFGEADNMKKKIGLNPKPKEGKIFLILQKEFQEIIREITRIGYYFKAKTGKAVKKIILVGGSASLPNLADYLGQNLEMKIEMGDPWKKINIDILKKKEYFKEALGIDPILYSTCIGAALRGLEKNPEKSGINLLKKN